MDIKVSFDSSTASAPSWFQSAVAYAVAQYDALITNPVSLTLNFGWGEENGNAIKTGTLAQNQSNGTYVNYAALTGAMKASAATDTDRSAYGMLPAADPTGGGKFYVPLALQKSLGLQPGTSSMVDGYIGLDSSRAFTFSPAGQIAAGTYDVIGVLDHEISEVLGRVGYLGAGNSPQTYGPTDLFRFAAPGQHATTQGAGSFSVDGQTMLQAFNNPLTGGDAADWASSVYGDTFGNTTAGIASHFSAADLALLDVLGYSVEPQAVAVRATPAVDTSASTLSADATPSSSPSSRVVPSYGAAVEASSASETFVFRKHPGQVTIDAFQVSGTGHDVLSFSGASFSSIADVLRHTTMSGDGAVIHIGRTDTVELFGVTKAELRTHQGALSLHS